MERERELTEQALRENEERLRLAVDAGQVGTWDWDIAADRVSWSERIYKFHGLQPGDFTGKVEDFVALVHPDDRRRVSEAIAAALERLPYSIEMRIVQPAGAVRWLSTSGRVIFDGDGKPVRMLGATVDITERKLAEQALRESEDRYRDLVENSHELICTHDLEGRVLSVNPWAARILGLAQGSLVGMNIRDGLAPEHRDEFDDYILKIKRDGSAKGLMVVRTARGEKRIWEYHNTLRIDGVDVPVVRGMAHDVTEIRQALASEREARSEAEAANRSKDEFLATLSHELRTPLTAVVGWASMLRSDRLDAETTAHALEVIERNAAAQAQIVEDILDVSRIITGKIRLNMTITDPILAVVAAVEAVRPAADAKGVALVISPDPHVGQITIDPDRLRQIAWHLLSNAVKFTPNGGRVEVRLERAIAHLRLIVSDNGEGISAPFLPHVFERFSQADSSTTRTHGGLGLGLAIVRHLVELHGGTVSAASEGEGATFTVMLPVTVEHEGAEVPVEESTRRVPDTAVAEPVRTYPPLEGIRLLVVEDEADTLAMLAVVFQRCGADVKAVSSTAEALSEVENWQPHVMVSDLGLPGEDGYSLMKRVRQKEATEGGFLPAIALSGYARTEDKAQALAAGYQLHLGKPVGPLELTNAVAGLIVNTGVVAPTQESR